DCSFNYFYQSGYHSECAIESTINKKKTKMKTIYIKYKPYTINFGLLACFLFLLASIAGCKKETMGELNDVSKNISEYISGSVGKATAVYLSETSLKNKTDYPAALPVMLKENASGLVTIKSSIDKSLIKIYDSLYHTKS